MPIRTRSSFLCFSSYIDVRGRSDQEMGPLTAANCPSKVLGSIFGKSLSATGSKSSMKGTIRKTENGINRSRSPVVLRS
jgi:hypothetical protein